MIRSKLMEVIQFRVIAVVEVPIACRLQWELRVSKSEKMVYVAEL